MCVQGTVLAHVLLPVPLPPLLPGRHPLTELLTDGRFIPNDTRLGLPAAAAVDGHADDQQPEAAGQCGPRMVLITGPNASGKSIYMKQVATLLLLCCGLLRLSTMYPLKPWPAAAAGCVSHSFLAVFAEYSCAVVVCPRLLPYCCRAAGCAAGVPGSCRQFRACTASSGGPA